MTEIDVFKFSSLKIFDGIKNDLPDESREIVDVYEDLLLCWNFKENNLHVVNWRAAQTKEPKFQKLILSAVPNFTVCKISLSFGGSYCSIGGSQGISVIEMPTRWGSDGIYQDGKDEITCKTISIHEHSINQIEIIQSRWHPNSPTDSHLLVLFSDNSLRIYDEGILKHIWRVGPLPTGNNLSYLRSLGDTAIDFDIAPAQISKSEFHSSNNTLIYSDDSPVNEENKSFALHSFSKRNQEQKVEWPIVILRGNGSIFVLCVGFNTEKPRLQGPLTMIPSQKDNYGDDSCSLIVIPTLPITLVIAENSGVLHHVLMIENQFNNDSSLNETKTLLPNDWNLYVIENIELELGLQENDKLDSSICPIFLRRDLINEHRYFCYHDTGLHGVTVGFVQQLQKYADDQTSEDDFNLNVHSRVEYILSTKAFSNSKVNAIIGFGILQMPSGIFAILSSGQVVSLSTVKTMLPLATDLSAQQPNLNVKSNGQQITNIPFDQHIRTLLKSDVSQPIIQLDKTNSPSPQEAFQLLMNSIQIMREKTFVRHDEVRQELIKRNKILSLMKNQQKKEIKQLFESKEHIQEKAYKLADMHEDIIERQQILQRRIQDISRISSLRLPAISLNEKEFAETIKKYKKCIDKLSQDVKQIKAKNEAQRKALESWSKSNDDFVKVSLPPKQEETIKEFLNDMMRQIKNLKTDVEKISSVIDS